MARATIVLNGKMLVLCAVVLATIHGVLSNVDAAAGIRALLQENNGKSGSGNGKGSSGKMGKNATDLRIRVDTPTGVTSNSQPRAGTLLAGTGNCVVFFGKVPASDVEDVCRMIANGQRTFRAAATNSKNSTQNYTFDVTASGGCDTGASENVLTVTGGRALAGTKVGVVCGREVPAGVCFIYFSNDQVRQQGKSVQRAAGKQAAGGKIAGQLVQAAASSNCGACLELCNCQNVNENCFPGTAHAEVQGRGRVPLKDLMVGDRVLTINSRGSAIYEPVYMFGHRDSKTLLPAIELTVRDSTGGPGVKVSLSGRHFIPVARNATAAAINTYAQDVQPGDVVTMMANDKLSAGTVIAARITTEQGAFNPYTEGGNIIVDGVLASCHSDWFLDDPVQRFVPHLTHLLPAAYQVVLKPSYLLYTLIGASASDKLNDILLAEWINHLTLTQVVVLTSGMGISAVAAAAGPAIIKPQTTAYGFTKPQRFG